VILNQAWLETVQNAKAKYYGLKSSRIYVIMFRVQHPTNQKDLYVPSSDGAHDVRWQNGHYDRSEWRRISRAAALSSQRAGD
jgi:hypothetical protein